MKKGVQLYDMTHGMRCSVKSADASYCWLISHNDLSQLNILDSGSLLMINEWKIYLQCIFYYNIIIIILLYIKKSLLLNFFFSNSYSYFNYNSLLHITLFSSALRVCHLTFTVTKKILNLENLIIISRKYIVSTLFFCQHTKTKAVQLTSCNYIMFSYTFHN